MADAHLGAAPPEVEQTLLGFLETLPGRAGSLVINGDLFDFWFEWRHVVPRTGFRVLAGLATLVERGVQVVHIAGNHDCWGGDVLRRDVGVTYELGPWEGVLAGWRSRVEHGDGVRPREDRGYRVLRRVLRHPLSIGAFRLLHPDIGSRLARGSSRASRAAGARDEGDALRAAACAALQRDRELELIVYSHSHIAALELVPGGTYANTGSWLDGPTFLRVEPSRIELRRWNGSAEGECLHTLDRSTEKALR